MCVFRLRHLAQQRGHAGAPAQRHGSQICGSAQREPGGDGAVCPARRTGGPLGPPRQQLHNPHHHSCRATGKDVIHATSSVTAGQCYPCPPFSVPLHLAAPSMSLFSIVCLSLKLRTATVLSLSALHKPTSHTEENAAMHTAASPWSTFRILLIYNI